MALGTAHANDTIHLILMCLIKHSECSLFLVVSLHLVGGLLHGVCSLFELQNWHPKGGINIPFPHCILAEFYIL